MMTIVLKKCVKNFLNGLLPKNLWTYQASILMYSFHKMTTEVRDSGVDYALRLVTLGYVLTRLGCIVLVMMGREGMADQLLVSHKFSFGIRGGMHQVIIGFTLALQLNANWVHIDLDLRNADTFFSRGKLKE